MYIEYIPGGSLCDLLQSMGAFNEQVVIGMVQQVYVNMFFSALLACPQRFE